MGDATALIRVPRFGDDYVMPVIEGVSDDALARGFGHFEGSARPAGRGNFALAAHRVTHGEPLRDMPLLQPGDEVLVETRDAMFTYELDTDPDDLTVTFRDVWVVAPRPVNPDPRRRHCRGPSSADHADHLLGALPHRQPHRGLRAPRGRGAQGALVGCAP